MMRGYFIFAVIALLSGVAMGGLLPFDLREVKNLLAIVDPATCRCALPQECPIAIRGAHLVGFRCNQPAGFQFCCARRIPGSPMTRMRIPTNVKELKKMLPTGFSGSPQSEQVLKVAEEIVKKAEDSGKDLESLLLTDSASDIRIKPATEVVLPTPTHNADRSDSDTNEPFCACLLGHRCDIGGADFSFGKSCKFGSVRCCGQDVFDHIESGGEERVRAEMEREDKMADDKMAGEVEEEDLEEQIKEEIYDEIEEEESQNIEKNENIVTEMVHPLPFNILPVQTESKMNEVDQQPTVVRYSSNDYKRRSSVPIETVEEDVEFVEEQIKEEEEEEVVTIVEPVEAHKIPSEYQQQQLTDQQRHEQQQQQLRYQQQQYQMAMAIERQRQQNLILQRQQQQGYFGQLGSMFEDARKGVNSFFFGQ